MIVNPMYDDVRQVKYVSMLLALKMQKVRKKKKIVHLGEIYQAYQFGDSLDH